MRWWVFACFVLVTCSSLTFAGGASQSSQARLQQAYPDAQFLWEDGRLARVWGATFGYGLTPEHSADSFVQDYSTLYGVATENLIPGNTFNDRLTEPLMYDPETGEHKFTLVYYTQYQDGIPVYQSELRLLVRNEPSCPLVLAACSLNDLGDYTVPAGATAKASDAAAYTVALDNEPDLTEFSPGELVIWPDTGGKPQTPRVALTFVGRGVAVSSEPRAFRFVVDVDTNEVLHKENLIVRTDVTGNVTGMATTIPKSDECNPEVSTKFPYAKVMIGSTVAYADPNGNYTITNSGTSAVTVQSPMAGRYVVINNYAGSTETLSQSVTPPGPANFVHNSANTTASIRSQTNAYVQTQMVRDFVLKYKPTYPTISTQTDFQVYVNRTDGYCPGNAWYDPSGDSSKGTLNFCSASGNYGDTSFSSVVHHEYGHHAVAKGGSGQGQYGEGAGDCFSVLLSDDPNLGYGFYAGQCGYGIRTAANSMTYPCSSDIHTCAQLLSGCIWSTRNALKTAYPSTYLSILSNLFVNSIPLHSGTDITPQIYTDLVTLDGGTSGAHYAQLTTGFSAHNMVPAPPPANDACANAITVCPGTSYTGSTTSATVDGSASCDGSSTGTDVWYKYAPTSGGSATFSLCTSSSTWDSVISIHSGCPGTTSNQSDCNDDGCGSSSGHGRITRTVVAGTTYYIRVAGYSSSVSGAFTLTITGPACGPTYYTLTTAVTGSGSITLDPSGGSYLSGTTVTVTAVPAAGWHFSNWTGDLTGSTNPTTIVMNGNKSVTAVFAQDMYTLTTSVSGSGSVTKNPNNLSYPSGSTVQVTANSTAGWHFDHWTGDLTGSTNPTNILMDGNKSVTAVFLQDEYTLTTAVTGSGTIDLDPAGGTYVSGTTVQVTANAADGWAFDHWTGDLTGSTNPTSIIVNGDKSVTAVFVQDQFTLTTAVTGSGSIDLTPPGGSYPAGTSVQVTATPIAGWRFDHWTGDLTGTTNPTNIVMDGNKSVTAVFFLIGDINCDGVLSYADINPFVQAVSFTEGIGWPYPDCPWLNADVNSDGTVSYADINPFVALLGK